MVPCGDVRAARHRAARHRVGRRTPTRGARRRQLAQAPTRYGRTRRVRCAPGRRRRRAQRIHVRRPHGPRPDQGPAALGASGIFIYHEGHVTPNHTAPARCASPHYTEMPGYRPLHSGGLANEKCPSSRRPEPCSASSPARSAPTGDSRSPPVPPHSSPGIARLSSPSSHPARPTTTTPGSMAARAGGHPPGVHAIPADLVVARPLPHGERGAAARLPACGARTY